MNHASTVFRALSLFTFSMLASSAALAERVVHAPLPIYAFNNGNRDSILFLAISNPSPVEQTVEVQLTATGDYYFAKHWDPSDNPSKYINGTHLLTCPSVRQCSMVAAARTMGPGENRMIAIRIRSTKPGAGNLNAVGYDFNTGTSVTIKVSGDDSGYILSTGSFQQENYNGVAYVGGPFVINGGRPF